MNPPNLRMTIQLTDEQASQWKELIKDPNKTYYCWATGHSNKNGGLDYSLNIISIEERLKLIKQHEQSSNGEVI
jgi:hypothetical protein